jgi:hypothetical protein
MDKNQRPGISKLLQILFVGTLLGCIAGVLAGILIGWLLWG